MQKFFFTIIASLLSLSLFAQPNSKQEGIECNLRSIDTLLTNKSIYQSLHISPDLTSVDVEDINRWATDVLESEFSESGLELSGGYDYRFWNQNIIDDSYEGGDIVPYKHRFLVSLKWNIMQSGLIGRDNFRQKVDILTRAKSREVINSTIKSLVNESAEQQMRELYGYCNVLIKAKAELYSALIEMQDELVVNNKATLLSLSDMRIKRSNVLRMYKNGVPPSSGVIDLERYIATQELFRGNEYDSLVESNNSILQNRLKQELTLNEANDISYWKEIRLSPYVRVSNYIDESMNRKNIGNLGVNLSMPLFTNTKSKRREVVSRGKLLANEEQVIRKEISLQVEDLLNQLNENYITLQLLIESVEYFNNNCSLATSYYEKNMMTISELTQRYVDNLDNNIEACKLIIEREEIKHSLFKVIYGV